MKFTAVGDMIIQRRIQPDFEGYDELTSFIEEGDARFFNLETTLNISVQRLLLSFYQDRCEQDHFHLSS